MTETLTATINGTTFASSDPSRPYCGVYLSNGKWRCAGWFAERRDAYSTLKNRSRSYYVIEEGGDMDTRALAAEFRI